MNNLSLDPNRSPKIVIAFVVLCLGVVSYIAINGGTSYPDQVKETVVSTPEQKEEKVVEKVEVKDRSTAAFVKAKRFVTQALKSPSTADFPFDAYTSINLGKDRYAVSSYVDSENSFGAKIRSIWEVVLKYKGGSEALTENWEVESMMIDNVQVYP